MKLYLSVLFSFIFFIFVFLVVSYNPYDKQYQAFLSEKVGLKDYTNKDINGFIKNYDNPVTVKYHMPSMRMLSIVYKQIGRFDDAIRVVNSYEKDKDYGFCVLYKSPINRSICRLVSVFSNNDITIDKNLIISEIYFEKGDYAKANEYFEKSNKMDLCYCSKYYALANNNKQANSYLHKCMIDNSISLKKRLLTKAYVLSKQQQYFEAEKIYKSLINSQCDKRINCTGNVEIYMELADLYKSRKLYSKAIFCYKKALKVQPYHYNANKGVAECFEKLNQKSEARHYYKQILKYQPDDTKFIELKIR